MLDRAWQRYYLGDIALVERYDKTIQLIKASTVLDVGCGQGLLSSLVKQRRRDVKTVIGVDVDALIMSRSKKQAFSRANISRLPFANGVFNTVVACEVLEHLKNTKTAIAEIVRVLKRGGRIITSVPSDMLITNEHKIAFANTGELTGLFGDSVNWRFSDALHHWYYAWGDKR